MALSDAAPYASSAWDLDEASGTRVDQVASRDLSDNNSVGSTTGVFGSALDYVVSGVAFMNAAFTPPTGKMSISLWIRTTATSCTILGWDDNATGTGGAFDREINLDASGKLEWYVFDGAVVNILSDSAINDGDWHHVVVVIDSTEIRMMIDGVEQADVESCAGHGYNSYSTPNIILGRRSATYYVGDIDDVAVLDGYAMSEAEAAEAYGGGTGVAFADWAGGGGGGFIDNTAAILRSLWGGVSLSA